LIENGPVPDDSYLTKLNGDELLGMG